MSTSPRKFYYLFPHVGLPQIFFQNASQLYEKLSGSSLNEEINRLWRSLGRKFGVNLTERLEGQKHQLPDNLELITIRMPAPQETPEALFIGLVFAIKKGFLSRTITSYRYFTLELGVPGNLSFVFCEWTNTKDHKNYGELKNSRMDTFVGAVRSLITQGKLPLELLTEPKPPVKASHPARIEEVLDAASFVEDEILLVWNRWADKIPEGLYQQALEEIENFYKSCMWLHVELKQDGKLSKETLDQYRSIIKQTVQELARKTLILGIEYGSMRDDDVDELEEDSDVSTVVTQRMQMVAKPAAVLVSILVEEVNKNHPRVEKNALNYWQKIVDAQVSCFNLGVDYAERFQSQQSEENGVQDPKGENSISDTYKNLLDVALNDPDLNVRRQAQVGVRELYPGGPAAFDNWLYKLIEGLRDPAKRGLSLSMLPMYGEMALPMLLPYLKDPDPEMRRQVTMIVVEIQKNKPK